MVPENKKCRTFDPLPDISSKHLPPKILSRTSAPQPNPIPNQGASEYIRNGGFREGRFPGGQMSRPVTENETARQGDSRTSAVRRQLQASQSQLGRWRAFATRMPSNDDIPRGVQQRVLQCKQSMSGLRCVFHGPPC